MVHVLAGALGVSAVVLASAGLFTVMKLLGAAYLVWIGLRTIAAARRDAGLQAGVAMPPMGPRRAFREGVLVEALSPRPPPSSLPSFRNSSIRRAAMSRSSSSSSAPSRSRSTRWPTPRSPSPPPASAPAPPPDPP